MSASSFPLATGDPVRPYGCSRLYRKRHSTVVRALWTYAIDIIRQNLSGEFYFAAGLLLLLSCFFSIRRIY
ncbi:hypothetical protein K435DRAFT_776112 [Dendrothele bispora CBS 962.96]|uniref:Uncharacterized protein n=1 Tax=Dendrothele bispora (strain CBS 962.96) TaxID=1314807 RepID=A0A4S8MFB6_DENBC|nr:hypothetical protein K435DRAFT_776112 [Dendrothele bispora CBS 962.96]